MVRLFNGSGITHRQATFKETWKSQKILWALGFSSYSRRNEIFILTFSSVWNITTEKGSSISIFWCQCVACCQALFLTWFQLSFIGFLEKFLLLLQRKLLKLCLGKKL